MSIAMIRAMMCIQGRLLVTPDLRFEGTIGGNGGGVELERRFKRTSRAKTLQMEEHFWNTDKQDQESSLAIWWDP